MMERKIAVTGSPAMVLYSNRWPPGRFNGECPIYVTYI